MKVSRLADYAVSIVLTLQAIKEDYASAQEIADLSGFPQPTASKILKMLAHAGIVGSIRGAKGGYFLEKTSEEITLAEIVEAIEGPIFLTSCVDGCDEDCDFKNNCATLGQWESANHAIREALKAVKLSDMALPQQA